MQEPGERHSLCRRTRKALQRVKPVIQAEAEASHSSAARSCCVRWCWEYTLRIFIAIAISIKGFERHARLAVAWSR